MSVRRFYAPLLLVVLLMGGFLSGCTDFRNSPVPMAEAMTDTAAVYQVHGIRFAVPDGLVPMTNRYVFTDLELGENRIFDPYNELTLFIDEERSPETILQDEIDEVEDPYNGFYDGPHRHNERRVRVQDRMIYQVTITYTPDNRRYADTPPEPGDPVRMDYAFIEDHASDAIWGFRLVPPDTSLTPAVAQDWADMLNTIAAAPQADPPFIGRTKVNGENGFCTGYHCVQLPVHWRLQSGLMFQHHKMTDGNISIPNVERVSDAEIRFSESSSPNEFERRTVGQLRALLRSNGVSGDVQESTMHGRHVLLGGVEPGSDPGQFQTVTRWAKITLKDTETLLQTVTLNMKIVMETSEPDIDATQLDLVKEMEDLYGKIYNSIRFTSE